MVINLKSQTDLSGFYIVYEGSTNLEKSGWYGLSHLMEHLMCKNFEYLRSDFEKEGIDWNAYTSSNEIVFYFTGLEEYLSKRKSEIIKLMSDFNVTPTQFENERKIVLQEYSDYFTNQTESHILNLKRKLFNDYDPIGLREDLEGLSFNDCLDFYERQFANPTKIINVSNGKKFETDIQFSNKKIKKRYNYGNYNPPIEKMEKFTNSSVIMLSPFIESDFSYITFINNMLSSGLSSPLYTELREKRGLVYYVRCGQARYNRQGITSIITQTSDNNIEEVYDATRYVLSNPKKFLTKERFNIIKQSFYVKLKKERINRFSNVQRWINPTGWSVYDFLNEITLERIMEVYDKYYNFDDYYLSHDKNEFDKK